MELVREILNRLGIIAHWMGFLISVVSLVVLLMDPRHEGDFVLILVFIPHIMGWAFRYLLSGNTKFMPW